MTTDTLASDTDLLRESADLIDSLFRLTDKFAAILCHADVISGEVATGIAETCSRTEPQAFLRSLADFLDTRNVKD